MHIWETAFQQRCKDNSMEKGQSIFSTNGAGTIGYPYAEMNFDLHLAPIQKLTQN